MQDPGISNTQPRGSYPPYDDGIEEGTFVLDDSGEPIIGQVMIIIIAQQYQTYRITAFVSRKTVSSTMSIFMYSESCTTRTTSHTHCWLSSEAIYQWLAHVRSLYVQKTRPIFPKALPNFNNKCHRYLLFGLEVGPKTWSKVILRDGMLLLLVEVNCYNKSKSVLNTTHPQISCW